MADWGIRELLDLERWVWVVTMRGLDVGEKVRYLVFSGTRLDLAGYDWPRFFSAAGC